MLQFLSVITLNNQDVLLETERIDPQLNIDGYMRYNIKTDDRTSVIYINTNYFRSPIFHKPEDATNYFEHAHYPEQPPSFSVTDTFTSAKLFTIGQTIAHLVLQEQSKTLLRKKD